MSSNISPHQLGAAVLDLVQTGAYPDEEDVVAAELHPPALTVALQLLREAREEVKSRISSSVKDSASDIDCWVSEAKQLRLDIEKSENFAQDLQRYHNDGEELLIKATDASNNVRFLEDEISFSQALAENLDDLQAAYRIVESVQQKSRSADIFEAVNALVAAERKVDSICYWPKDGVSSLLKSELRIARQETVQRLLASWDSVIQVDLRISKLTINDTQKRQSDPTEGSRFPLSISRIATALSSLGLFNECVSRFALNVTNAILLPCLQPYADLHACSLVCENDSLELSELSSEASLDKLFADLSLAIDYLRSRLPNSIVTPMASLIMPILLPELKSTWLLRTSSGNVHDLQELVSNQRLLRSFGSFLSSNSWPGKNQLDTWSREFPSNWVQKRQESCLKDVRKLLVRGFGTVRTVERTETQTVLDVENAFADQASAQDWNAAWSDDEDTFKPEDESVAQNHKAEGNSRTDEDEITAWGLSEDSLDEEVSSSAVRSNATDHDVGAWGWGDDDENKDQPGVSNTPQPLSPRQNLNPNSVASEPDAQLLTLKERYNITALPDGILAVISQIFSDIGVIHTHSYPEVDSVPIAVASNQYTLNASGNMFLYNDNLWLSDQLNQATINFKKSIDKYAKTNAFLKLESHISALEQFGKRAYGKEMESQRTIIKDFLDGAQGFSNCSISPFAQECDLAISSVVDRLDAMFKEWNDILSHSALLQSIGSLLSTAIDKIIVDVEDLGDISEPESQRLTAFCKQIIALEHLFIPRSTETISSLTEDPVPLTAVYVPGWFKFQYLAEILDSSLADIKYLWTDGNIRLEFTSEEVVDLIKALFADSDHRRRAIAEIQKQSRDR
ncbi:MAG: hypothetical protein Q9167_001366 [Letrouitia subvulpina]